MSQAHPTGLKADCLFCRIIRKELPANIVHEDDDIIVFHDIKPAQPVHLLFVPKVHVVNFYDADEAHAEVLGHLFGRIGRIARQVGLNDGFRTIVNTGRVGRQEVAHLHVHVLGGPDPIPGGLI